MGNAISWTDDTWNPTDGCEVCSPGCANCYAMRFAGRFSKPGERYHGLVTIAKNKRAVWTGEGRLDGGKLTKPLGWKRPRRIFVNSMSDLFFERFTNEEIAAVFGVMAACPQHTFQILTKRAARMREWFAWLEREAASCNDLVGMSPSARCFVDAQRVDSYFDLYGKLSPLRRAPVVEAGLTARWPLPNVWLGVSVENQEAADERIPHLLRTPAAIRFLSCEPLIGEIVLPSSALVVDGIDWVIAGAESGPGARPCDVEWLRMLRHQCDDATIAFFLKQAVEDVGEADRKCARNGDVKGCGERIRYHVYGPRDSSASCGCTVECSEDMNWHPSVGAGEGSKRKGGGVIELPYLDGVQHAAFPEVSRG